MYVERKYRGELSSDLTSFNVKIKETDLLISLKPQDITPEIKDKITQYIFLLRNELEKYIEEDSDFLHTLNPYLVRPGAPAIAFEMAKCANMAGVGPMAAVAGGFAQMVGKYAGQFSQEVIVENGGDIYLKSSKVRKIGIFAGSSPFSGRIALKIQPSKTPLGVCTSSGTVGPSLSFGKADAVVIMARSAFLADACATATGNRVTTPADFNQAMEFARKINGVNGILLIKDDKMAAWGSIEIAPV
ncbi:MAG: UPF0280 family protein [Bacillota bacterium]|jgi:ApbE superfamily uncharacterized protein (UPF0280 family)